MTSDQEHEEPPPYDEEDAARLTVSCISLGLEWLNEKQSPERWSDYAWQLILLAKHMDDDELLELANAVKRGPQKRKRGNPAKIELQENILHALSYPIGKWPEGASFGLKGVRRVQAIAYLAKAYKMSPDAAGKAYDKAKSSLSGKKRK